MQDEVLLGKILVNVIDEILEGVQVISPEWRYLYVNQTVVNQSQKTRNELMGKTMMECYPGIDQTPLFTQLKRSMEERVSIRMENEFTFPDGAKGWFLLFIHPVAEGIAIFSQDITQQKNAEIELHDKISELNKITSIMLAREVEMADLKSLVQKLLALSPKKSAVIEDISPSKVY